MASRIDVEKFFRERRERQKLEEERRNELQRQKNLEAAKEAYYKFCREIMLNAVKKVKTTEENPDVPWYMTKQKPHKLEYHVDVDQMTFYCALKKAWEKHHYIDDVNKPHLLPPPNEHIRKSFSINRNGSQNSKFASKDNPSLAVPRFGDFPKLANKLDARKDKIKDIVDRIAQENGVCEDFSFKLVGKAKSGREKHPNPTQQYLSAITENSCEDGGQILRAFRQKLNSYQDNMEDSVETCDPDSESRPEIGDFLTDNATVLTSEKTNMTEEMSTETAPKCVVLTESQLVDCPSPQPTELTDVKVSCEDKPSGIATDTVYDNRAPDTHADIPLTSENLPVPSAVYGDLLAPQVQCQSVYTVLEDAMPLKSAKSEGFLRRVKKRLSRAGRRLFPCVTSVTTGE